MRYVFLRAVLAILFCLPLPTHAAEKKEEKKKPEPPSIAVVLPLAISPGVTNRVKIRGQNLTSVSEIHFANAQLQTGAVIKTKSKAEVPKEMDVKKVGDTQLDLELRLAADIAPGTNSFTLVSPDGESKPGTLVVIASATLVGEKEPNGSFREAQTVEPGKWVQGSISEAKEVDVFRVACKAGEMLVAEIQAARYGSTLDSILTLYDEQGHELAQNDDFNGAPDSLLRIKIPKDGRYLLSVQDAQDKGGSTYVYLLGVRVE